MQKLKSADQYFESNAVKSPVLAHIRKILSSTELEETIKWGIPCYTVNGKNVVGLCAFKSHAGLWFYNGVFHSDPDKLLINAQEGKTEAMRQWRFPLDSHLDSDQVLRYVLEAIDNQKKGKEFKPKKKPLIIPSELSDALKKHQLIEWFEVFNLTQKREFVEYIETAKRAETKKSRLQKILPLIKSGVGLHDKYR